jgi:hypothetical protein
MHDGMWCAILVGMNETARKVRVGDFVARLIHFNAGWRWWASYSGPKAALAGEDDVFGLAPGGYEDRGAAFRAMRRAAVRLTTKAEG